MIKICLLLYSKVHNLNKNVYFFIFHRRFFFRSFKFNLINKSINYGSLNFVFVFFFNKNISNSVDNWEMNIELVSFIFF
jgi:hypothetical protein